MELAIGQTVGDYEILRVLGSGGMGKVYQVRNKISHRVEAMKVLLPDLKAEPELVDRFLREIRISASLDHPNIAGLRTAQSIDNQLVMIMEFVEGSTLDALMRQARIPMVKGVDYVCQALAALTYAHARGVVHRDIKPANMMLTPEGVLKLMDFGIAKVASDQKLTKTGLMVGSVYYMSPEQIEGRELDARSDLYSLGVTLYEIVTGKRPFNGDSEYQIMAAHLKNVPTPPRDLDHSLPAELNEIILMALAKDPAQRFQTADAFRNALSTFLPKDAAAAAGAKTQAAPPPTVREHKSNARVWYMLAGSLATIAVIAAAVIEVPKFMHAGAASKTPVVATAPAPQTTPAPTPPPQAQETTPVAATPQPQAATTPPPSSSSVKSLSTPADTRRKPVQVAANQIPQQTTLEPQPVQQQTQTQPAVQPPPQPATPQISAADQAALGQLNERLDLMSVRAGVVRTSLQNLARDQARTGLSPNAELVGNEQRMTYQMQQADLSLKQNNPAEAKRHLDAAERDLEKLEKKFGK